MFDFRSKRFALDALALARLTGGSLALCRQELFIAEGDMAEAFEVLRNAARPVPVARDIH